MKIEKEELDKIVEQQVELNNLLKRIGFIETEKDGLLKIYIDVLMLDLVASFEGLRYQTVVNILSSNFKFKYIFSPVN